MLNQRERTVITVIYKKKIYNFGSLASIFEYFNNNELGINYNTIRLVMGKNRHDFSNKFCTIKRSKLITKAKSTYKNDNVKVE